MVKWKIYGDPCWRTRSRKYTKNQQWDTETKSLQVNKYIRKVLLEHPKGAQVICEAKISHTHTHTHTHTLKCTITRHCLSRDAINGMSYHFLLIPIKSYCSKQPALIASHITEAKYKRLSPENIYSNIHLYLYTSKAASVECAWLPWQHNLIPL